MGRPTVYNDQRAEAICAAVERIGFVSVAAEINGIHRNTLQAWLERGDNGEEPYASFADRFRTSLGKWREKQVEKVTDPCWLLERSDPGVFGRRDKVEHSGNIALELAELEGQSSQDLKALIKEVLSEGEQTNATTESDV